MVANELETQVTVISCLTYFLWSTNGKPTHAGWTSHGYQVIAFVGIEDSHYTLSIIADLNWAPPSKKRKRPNWRFFHFDSLSKVQKKKKTLSVGYKKALGFAAWVLDLPQDKFGAQSVPVPRQLKDSNDCGLYATRFLRTFLGDIDASINWCMAVSLPPPPLI
jgi:Ulp1 family protease